MFEPPYGVYMRTLSRHRVTPSPLTEPRPYKPFVYQLGAARYLPWIDECDVEIPAAFGNRRTRMPVQAAPEGALSALLWHSGKTLEERFRGKGRPWIHRTPLSAGGCHPVDLFLMSWPPVDVTLLRYDCNGHAVAPCQTDADASVNWMEALNDLVPHGAAGTLVWFGIEWSRTRSLYSDADTMVWRDVGVVLATLAFVGEASGVAVLPFGATGEPWFSQVIRSNGAVTGGGGCLVGRT